MKFNNKLKLPQYIKLVDEIVEGYFEQTTGEYVPHIGEIHMAYLYFKNCAVAEDGDEVTPENIDVDGDVDFEKLEAVLNDPIFVRAIEIMCSAYQIHSAYLMNILALVMLTITLLQSLRQE